MPKLSTWQSCELERLAGRVSTNKDGLECNEYGSIRLRNQSVINLSSIITVRYSRCVIIRISTENSSNHVFTMTIVTISLSNHTP